jgi:hypothetical protein
MQYLLIISHDDEFKPTERLVADIRAWIKEMERRGIRLQGNPLRPASEATTVRIRGGKVICENGPFSDSAEQICGYELVECESADDAIAVASTHPMAQAAAIEVRPIWRELTT